MLCLNVVVSLTASPLDGCVLLENLRINLTVDKMSLDPPSTSRSVKF